MAKVIGMAAEERKWQAESDARVLAESQTIMKDPKRLAAAARAAQDMAKKQAEEAKAMGRVAAKGRKPKKGGK